MPKYGVQVYTWGTEDKVSNGLDNFVDQEMLGETAGMLQCVLPFRALKVIWR